jgi:hypothetical protein
MKATDSRLRPERSQLRMNVNILLLPTQTSLARFRSTSAVSTCDSLHQDILPYQPISKLPNRLELPGTPIQTCRLCLSTLCYAALQSIYALCFVSWLSVSLNFRNTSPHPILGCILAFEFLPSLLLLSKLHRPSVRFN